MGVGPGCLIGRADSTVYAFHDPEVTLRRIAKDSQCGW
jgi:hypothetical protein